MCGDSSCNAITSHSIVFVSLCVQIADETGKVQYATQTVTVTERDAKALGQPVGSTTTVLLTAYPGGHNGSVASSDSGQQFLSQGATTTAASAPAASSAPNVQVVYSAAHIDSIPDTIVSSMSTTDTQSHVYTTDATSTQGSTVSTVNPSMTASSEAYLSLAGQQLLSNASSSGTGSVAEVEPDDLATELISQYTGSPDFQPRGEASSSGAATSSMSTATSDVSTSSGVPVGNT